MKHRDLALFEAVVVAPYAGAWIETCLVAESEAGGGSPPMRGRGLKQAHGKIHAALSSRPLCGGVD